MMMGVNGEMVGKIWEATKLDDIDIDKKYCQKKHAQKREEDVFPFGCSDYVGGQTRGCLFTDSTAA